MIKAVTVAGLVLIVASFAVVALLRDEPAGKPIAQASALSPAELLAAAGAGEFARPQLPYAFRFPADHGSHSRYRTESWQIAGVLKTRDQRRLGIQLVVIRLALGSEPSRDRSTDWASGEIYAALFSISDPDGERLHTDRRLTRGGIGLADWRANPMRLWVEDWQIERSGGARPDSGLKLRLAAHDLRLDLQLRSLKALIDHNRIRAENDPAAPPFVYYVEPRLEADGTLVDGENSIALTGTVSIEHAWGELPLPGGPVVQDRFTLYLADGRELFLVRSHRADGVGSANTGGLLILADQTPVLLDNGSIDLQAADYWISERTGARYPLHWSLRIPERDIELQLTAYHEPEEGVIWAPFWSGPLRLANDSGNAAGDGYMQLNGYHER